MTRSQARNTTLTVIVVVMVIIIGMLVKMRGVAGTQFEFTDQIFPNGVRGDIEASVQKTDDGTLAVAWYYTTEEVSLGEYRDADGFYSTNPDTVRQWALDHFGDRNEPTP